METLKHDGEYRKEDLKNLATATVAAAASLQDRTSSNVLLSNGNNYHDDNNNEERIIGEDNRISGNSGGGGSTLRPTLSQAMMNSNLLNSLPKYIFQSDHERLTSVNEIIKDLKEQQERQQNLTDTACEVSEYPIEYIENQAHVIKRHMNIK